MLRYLLILKSQLSIQFIGYMIISHYSYSTIYQSCLARFLVTLRRPKQCNLDQILILKFNQTVFRFFFCESQKKRSKSINSYDEHYWLCIEKVLYCLANKVILSFIRTNTFHYIFHILLTDQNLVKIALIARAISQKFLLFFFGFTI